MADRVPPRIGKGCPMSKYTIRIERNREECRQGRCGHLHEIPVTFRQTQIVCSDLSCREAEVSLIKHILVPYDGSGFSNRAFEFALDLAKKYGSSITVGTVMSSPLLASSFLDIGAVGNSVDKETLASIEKHFDKIRHLSKRFSIPVRTEVFVSSSVAESLVSFATSNSVDLIVMGTRGRGDNRLMLGSVSISISQKASVPVLLVK